MAHPTLIFTPGAWHSPECYSLIISKLEPLGYKCIALPLLAVEQKPAVTDLQPDTDALRKRVLEEIDAGNDVVMVVHSWSGIIANGALVGLGKAEREKEGKKGGVLRIAYICSFAPEENVSLVTAFGGITPEWYDVKVCLFRKLGSVIAA